MGLLDFFRRTSRTEQQYLDEIEAGRSEGEAERAEDRADEAHAEGDLEEARLQQEHADDAHDEAERRRPDDLG